jgi:acyl-CoA dehydrogenase
MDLTLPEELTMVRDTVREFVQNELVPIERDVLVREKGGMRGAAIPREKHDRLKKLAVEQGLWAMSVPEALGGGGLNTLGGCLVAEELGKSFVDFDFGDVPPILFETNAEQREKYLNPLIAGEKECALALREPATDELKLRAVPDGDDWRLDGRKLAQEADLFLVFARTDAGVTCFIVERDREGVFVQDGEVILKDVRLPISNLLGEQGGAMTLERKYVDARRVRLAARRVGTASRLLEMSSQYARDWRALGQPLSVRPAVQRHLADMAIEADAARWLVYRAAWEIDEGKSACADALHAIVFSAEMVQRAIDHAIQVYGGPALAPDLPILRIYGKDGDAHRADRILELERFQIVNDLPL